MKDTPPQEQAWWGTTEFVAGTTKRWEIGPLNLWVKRLTQEWWLAFERDDNYRQQPAAALDCDDSAWADHPGVERYITRQAQTQLHIMPALADRPVVTRPLVPLHLCAGEEATIFVSLPVWIRIEAGQQKLLIKELAIQRLSDTWFGSSTLEGELCYASTTHCRLDLGEIPAHAYRAITPVLIQNRSDQILVMERLNLPVHHLSVYASDENRLWTSGVSLRWEEGATVAMKIETRPPAQAGKAKLLCGPRQVLDKGGVIRTVTSLFA